ncbi:hypothetical protein [Myroides odoratus]|uniref:hypothetical protein n=1 Tax=Myroides odoratus TaxID=256 RepID=UPI0033425935
MKKLLLLFAVLLTNVTFAQHFEVTPEGLKSKTNQEPYLVLDFEGKTASELYDAAVLFVNETFKNPNHVIKSDIKDKKLRFSQMHQMRVSNGGAKIPVDIRFDNELSFKDGKVKYEIVALDMGMLQFTGNIWKCYPIWNEKNGKLRLEEEKNELEAYFNVIVQQFVDAVNTNDDEW